MRRFQPGLSYVSAAFGTFDHRRFTARAMWGDVGRSPTSASSELRDDVNDRHQIMLCAICRPLGVFVWSILGLLCKRYAPSRPVGGRVDGCGHVRYHCRNDVHRLVSKVPCWDVHTNDGHVFMSSGVPLRDDATMWLPTVSCVECRNRHPLFRLVNH